jgi:hypothetical protein
VFLFEDYRRMVEGALKAAHLAMDRAKLSAALAKTTPHGDLREAYEADARLYRRLAAEHFIDAYEWKGHLPA